MLVKYMSEWNQNTLCLPLKEIILILQRLFSYPCVCTDVCFCLYLPLVYGIILFHIMYGGYM